jgi:hypothetical protein
MIPAQRERLATNWVEFSKQRGTTEGWIDKAASLVWRSERQEDEEAASGSWNMEVSLRCCASPMPMRLRRVWQHCFPLGSWQDEVSHGNVST